ncbi:MAG TPA: AAA family ATPase [Nocardioidaceae bacterium]|nr:AAA family ATPase [Nocardioidaceae bacterium]
MGEPERALRSGRRRSVFVGREREIATIAEALRSPPAVVLVEGDAGVGKSRLVQEVGRHLEIDEAAVLHCASPPVEPQFPLGPVVEALQRRSVRGLALSPLAGALRQLLPEWGDELPAAPDPLPDPTATRYRLYRAVAEVIERLKIELLILEDGQWADPATLELLLMMTSSPTARINLVITCRPQEVPDDSLLLRLSSHSAPHLSQRRVSIGPLSVDEVGQLVADMFETETVTSSFVEFLHDRTDGVALAVEESLALLRDRGDIVWRGGGWSRRALEELKVPPTVRDSVLERVQRLAPEARPILQAAAVLEAPADEALLADVAELAADEVRTGLDRALDAGLLHEVRPGMVAFRHALTSRAVEEAMPASERRRWHRRAAEVLRHTTPEPIARLSRHYREANDVAAWSHYAEAAATLALQSGDDRTAVELLLDLLTVPHPLDRRTQITRALGDAAAWGVAGLGDLGGRVTDALRSTLDDDVVDPQSRGELRVLLGRLLLQLGEFDEAAAQTSSAIPDLADRPELAVRAMISLSWPRGYAWTGDKHLDWLRRASERLPDLPPGPERTTLEVDQASALLMLGQSDGWAMTEALVGRSGSLVERRQYARCLMNVGHVAIAWGRDDQARRALDRAIELMRETGYERLLNSAALTTAYLDWHSGRWDGLAQRVDAAIDAEDTLPEARLEARYTRALLRLASGDRQSAEAELRTVVAELSRRGIIDALLASSAALSQLLLLDDNPTEALEISRPAIQTLEAKNMWPWDASIVSAHAQGLVETGEAAEAEALMSRFADGLGDRDAPAPRAALLGCRGIVAGSAGDLAAAVDHYAAAAAIWSALPRPYQELLTLERLGSWQVALGETDQGAEILTDVQHRLAALGARWDADRVARRLRRLGVEVARVWRGGRRGYGDQLSPRELDVARLVAQGMTNRQVATALFLSPRTVDRHLSAVMRKLNVHSRTAVALAITEAGPSVDDPKIG